MFLVSTAALGISFSRPCLAQIDIGIVGDWSAFAKLSDILREIRTLQEPLIPGTTAVKVRRMLTNLVTMLNSAYLAVTKLQYAASASSCSVDEEVDARLVAADSVKAAFIDLSRMVNEFSGYLKPVHMRKVASSVAVTLRELAFDRWGWLGNIRRYCLLSGDEKQRFLQELRSGADAINSLRQPALALRNQFELDRTCP